MIHVLEQNLPNLRGGFIHKHKQIVKVVFSQAFLPDEEFQDISRALDDTDLGGVFIDVVDNLIFEHPPAVVFLFVICDRVSVKVVGP